MPLTSVISGKAKKPRRILLYGIEGIGKSTFAASAPKPIGIPTEHGLDDIGMDRYPVATSWSAVQGTLMELHREKHDYKTIEVASPDWLERLMHAAVCRENNDKSLGEIDYGKGPGMAAVHWQWFLGALQQLRDERNMGIVVVAHSTTIKYAEPGSSSYARFAPALHSTASNMVRQWADEVLFANYRSYTVEEDSGFNKKRQIATGNGERVMFTQERPAFFAKNRLGLPPEMPLSFDSLTPYIEGNPPPPAGDDDSAPIGAETVLS